MGVSLGVPVKLWAFACLWLTAALIFGTAVARADIGGSVPSPGGCDYPSTGSFGAAFGEYDYACQFPVEENGARHTTLFGGGMWVVTGTIGASFLVFNASVSATSPAGILRGITYWACPDFSFSADPNPAGAWKNYIKPKPCKTIAPRPELIRDQPTPPFGAAQPPPVPEPIVAPEPVIPPGQSVAPAQPPQSPAITNPTNPNSAQVPNEPRP
jgi:hypothetical protein